MLFNIKENGRETVNVDREGAQTLGYSEAAIVAAEGAAQGALSRNAIRADISDKAGDIPSLLGTTADATQILLFGLASLVAKLAEADSLSDVRKSAAPFAEMSADFLAKVEAGTVKLPFQTKGMDTVIADIETRATAVSDVLAASIPQEGN